MKILMLNVFLLCFLSACTLNPETGKNHFNIVSTREEIEVGTQADVAIRKEYGVYPDETLQSYVQDVGKKIANVVDRQDVQYTFTVLDSPLINAFALPGGFLYITRGALAQMNSEAELAFVLGHEIAHVTAKHGAQKLSQIKSINFANILAHVITNQDDLGTAGRLANMGINLAVLGYGRENEFESDILGLDYAHRAGYDTVKGARFLHTLKRQHDFEPDWLSQFLVSHPPHNERIERLDNKNNSIAQEKGKVGKNDFLTHIQGIYMGDRKVTGFLNDNTYVNDFYNYQLELPFNFSVKLSKKDHHIIEFQSALSSDAISGGVLTFKFEDNATITQLISNFEALKLRDFSIDKKGVFTPKFGEVYQYNIKDSKMGSGIFYCHFFTNGSNGFVTYFRTSLLTQRKHLDLAKQSLESVSHIAVEDLKKRKRYFLKIYHVKKGDSLSKLAEIYLGIEDEAERILAFNDLEEGYKIKSGDMIKIPPFYKDKN